MKKMREVRPLESRALSLLGMTFAARLTLLRM
jgi:hypothetical protein